MRWQQSCIVPYGEDPFTCPFYQTVSILKEDAVNYSRGRPRPSMGPGILQNVCLTVRNRKSRIRVERRLNASMGWPEEFV